jgi:6-pyruvoyltetrahydropterin/6-carboxytetrahydropterin synthase
MISVTKRFEFDAAHRLFEYEGVCSNVHGHRYVVELTVAGTVADLGKLGMLVDFGLLKQRFGGWLRDMWDHALIFNPEDPLAASDRLRTLKHAFMPHGNPTAENMAVYLHEVARSVLPALSQYRFRIRVYETPGSWAEYDGEG